jgi:hypothetical protein
MNITRKEALKQIAHTNARIDALLTEGEFNDVDEEILTDIANDLKIMIRKSNESKPFTVNAKMKSHIIFTYLNHQKEISSIIEKNRNKKVALSATKILNILGLKPEEVHRTCFESCSFVIAMADMKTVIEICFAPETISFNTWKRNPLFL